MDMRPDACARMRSPGRQASGALRVVPSMPGRVGSTSPGSGVERQVCQVTSTLGRPGSRRAKPPVTDKSAAQRDARQRPCDEEPRLYGPCSQGSRDKAEHRSERSELGVCAPGFTDLPVLNRGPEQPTAPEGVAELDAAVGVRVVLGSAGDPGPTSAGAIGHGVHIGQIQRQGVRRATLRIGCGGVYPVEGGSEEEPGVPDDEFGVGNTSSSTRSGSPSSRAPSTAAYQSIAARPSARRGAQ